MYTFFSKVKFRSYIRLDLCLKCCFCFCFWWFKDNGSCLGGYIKQFSSQHARIHHFLSIVSSVNPCSFFPNAQNLRWQLKCCWREWSWGQCRPGAADSDPSQQRWTFYNTCKTSWTNVLQTVPSIEEDWELHTLEYGGARSRASVLLVRRSNYDASLRWLHRYAEDVSRIREVADSPLEAGLCVFTCKHRLWKRRAWENLEKYGTLGLATKASREIGSMVNHSNWKLKSY